MNPYKFKHFYKNKYLVTPFSNQIYGLSYNYKYKCLWFRVPKVGTRSINEHFIENTPKHQYIYSAPVGYAPNDFKDWFKFAFVREPTDRFISSWKDKVLNRNMFGFTPEQHEKMQDLGNFISWVEIQDIDHEIDQHLRTQHQLIDLENIDFIGRFESFEADLKKVAKKIGMPLKKMHHKNTSGKKQIEVSEADKLRIRNLYKRDYELFYPHLL